MYALKSARQRDLPLSTLAWAQAYSGDQYLRLFGGTGHAAALEMAASLKLKVGEMTGDSAIYTWFIRRTCSQRWRTPLTHFGCPSGALTLGPVFRGSAGVKPNYALWARSSRSCHASQNLKKFPQMPPSQKLGGIFFCRTWRKVFNRGVRSFLIQQYFNDTRRSSDSKRPAAPPMNS